MQSPSSQKEKKKWLLDWNTALNKLGYLAYYEVPYSKEVLSFLLTELPYLPNRDLQGLYWLSGDEPTKLEKLVSGGLGKNLYDSNLSFEKQGIPSIPSSIRHYATSFLFSYEASKYYETMLKRALPKGDLFTLYGFYFVFSSEIARDEAIAWAAIRALEIHRPKRAHLLEQDFLNRGLTKPSDSQVDKILNEWSPYLPKPGEGKFIHTRFDSDIKPYVLSELAIKLKKLEAN